MVNNSWGSHYSEECVNIRIPVKTLYLYGSPFINRQSRYLMRRFMANRYHRLENYHYNAYVLYRSITTLWSNVLRNAFVFIVGQWNQSSSCCMHKGGFQLCTQPMRDGVTSQRRHSLVGCEPSINLDIWLFLSLCVFIILHLANMKK